MKEQRKKTLENSETQELTKTEKHNIKIHIW